MSRPDKGILRYETTLDEDAQQCLDTIGHVGWVIGIPSHRNGRTVAEVVHACIEGAANYLAQERVLIINADGGSSDNTSRPLLDAVMPPNVARLATLYRGPLGKGTAIRAIFEAAARTQARGVIVMSARAPGVTPVWVRDLRQPIDDGHDLAVGAYARSASASLLTENLAHPLVRAFFGAHMREPLASEFSVSGHWAADLAGKDVWETDVSRHGVDAWLAIESTSEGRDVVQVELGYRGESNTEPGTPMDPRFLQTAGTLFRVLTTHRRAWMRVGAPRAVPVYGPVPRDTHLPAKDCVDALLDAFCAGYEQCYAEWESIVSDETLHGIEDVLRCPREGFHFPVALWVRIALESAIVYNKGEGDPDKVVEALLPLYYGQCASHVLQTSGMSIGERQQVVRRIADAFWIARPAFMRRWERYQPWPDGMDL